VFLLSIATFALQIAAALVALAIARAPGWSRARIAAALAGTAGLYSGFDILGTLLPRTGFEIAFIWSANLTLAAAHVAVWIWFSFSDERGRWSSVPQRLRWVSLGHLGWTALLALSGNAVDLGRMQRVQVEWLGVDFVQPSLTPLASLSAALSLVILFISFGEQVRQARRGVVGARWNTVGFSIYAACVIEELLVASGALSFIYLAEVGYVGLVIPVVAQFVQRFIGDAHQLQELTERLEGQVRAAAGERDAARDAMVAQERFAALGRMAGGVGHEINNPLQILTLSIDDLRDSPAVNRDPLVAELVEHAAGAAERIGLIVAGLRTYSLPAERALEPHAPEGVVEEAIAAARASLGTRPRIEADLGAAPRALIDRERMLHALGHAIANAVRSVSARSDESGRVDLATGTSADGEPIVEVRDNGLGFPDSVLSRLGEPFVTTRAPGEGMGLGLFIIRGIVSAHGGRLELENEQGGGATLRIVLPAAQRA